MRRQNGLTRATMVLLATLGVSGCASQSGLPTGSLGAGAYLTKYEQNYDCPALRSTMDQSVGQIRTYRSQVAKEEQDPPNSISQWWERLNGPPDSGAASTASLRREEARAQAINAQLAAKGCPTVDIEAAAAAPAAQPAAAPVAPITVAKK